MKSKDRTVALLKILDKILTDHSLLNLQKNELQTLMSECGATKTCIDILSRTNIAKPIVS